MSLKWNGDIVMGEIRDGTARRLGRAAAHVATAVKHKISVPYPPSSRPGQPPRRRSGALRASVLWLLDVTDRNRPVAYIQANTPYARRLEVEQDRPYLESTLYEEAPAVERIFRSWF